MNIFIFKVFSLIEKKCNSLFSQKITKKIATGKGLAFETWWEISPADGSVTKSF
jgi:hypothetical protein